MIGRYQCYWNKEAKIFSTINNSSKYQTKEEAEKELIEFASFVKPSHIVERNYNF
jgi:hypothetical protein